MPVKSRYEGMKPWLIWYVTSTALWTSTEALPDGPNALVASFAVIVWVPGERSVAVKTC